MGGAIAIVVCLGLEPGSTAPSPLEIDISACPGLHPERMADRLSAELTAASGRGAIPALPPVRVEFRCEVDQVEIRIEDPVTEKAVSRTTPAPAVDDPERERVLGMAATQLVIASWLELLVRVPVAAPVIDATMEADPGSGAAGTPSPRQTARAIAEAAIPQSPPPVPRLRPNAISIGLGPRVRGAVLTGGAALQYGRLLDPNWQILVEGGAEGGRVQRSLGRVDALVARLGAGARYRSRPVGDLRFDAVATAHVAYVDLRGLTDDSRVKTGRAWGVSGDFAGAVGPTVDTPRLRAGLLLEAGYLVSGPEARVRGDATVQLHGPWVGAQLRVGVRL